MCVFMHMIVRMNVHVQLRVQATARSNENVSPSDGLNFKESLRLYGNFNGFFGIDLGTSTDGVGEGGCDCDVVLNKERVRDRVRIFFLVL